MLKTRQQNSIWRSDLQETTKATKNITREATIKLHTHASQQQERVP